MSYRHQQPASGRAPVRYHDVDAPQGDDRRPPAPDRYTNTNRGAAYDRDSRDYYRERERERERERGYPRDYDRRRSRSPPPRRADDGGAPPPPPARRDRPRAYDYDEDYRRDDRGALDSSPACAAPSLFAAPHSPHLALPQPQTAAALAPLRQPAPAAATRAPPSLPLDAGETTRPRGPARALAPVLARRLHRRGTAAARTAQKRLAREVARATARGRPRRLRTRRRSRRRTLPSSWALAGSARRRCAPLALSWWLGCRVADCGVAACRASNTTTRCRPCPRSRSASTARCALFRCL